MLSPRYLLLAVFSTLLAITPSLSANTADWQESAEVAAIFKASGLNGTFVLYDVANETFMG